MELYKPFDFLSKDECQEIINFGKIYGTFDALTGDNKVADKKVRANKICWYKNKKYKKKILKVFKTFDKNIVLKDNLQITFYTPQEFYDWHIDTRIYKDKYWFGFIREFKRTLSMTVELQSAPKAGLFLDYKRYPNIPRKGDKDPIIIKPGQAFVFLSEDLHTAQNYGIQERISLVAWGSKLVK